CRSALKALACSARQEELIDGTLTPGDKSEELEIPLKVDLPTFLDLARKALSLRAEEIAVEIDLCYVRITGPFFAMAPMQWRADRSEIVKSVIRADGLTEAMDSPSQPPESPQFVQTLDPATG
ncbi:hypothetical protein FOZ62_019026, partial [Perkinsus olseni]